eukprot:tig00000350_g24316.t1
MWPSGQVEKSFAAAETALGPQLALLRHLRVASKALATARRLEQATRSAFTPTDGLESLVAVVEEELKAVKRRVVGAAAVFGHTPAGHEDRSSLRSADFEALLSALTPLAEATNEAARKLEDHASAHLRKPDTAKDSRDAFGEFLAAVFTLGFSLLVSKKAEDDKRASARRAAWDNLLALRRVLEALWFRVRGAQAGPPRGDVVAPLVARCSHEVAQELSRWELAKWGVRGAAALASYGWTFHGPAAAIGYSTQPSGGPAQPPSSIDSSAPPAPPSPSAIFSRLSFSK